jgi:hypothetical protein
MLLWVGFAQTIVSVVHLGVLELLHFVGAIKVRGPLGTKNSQICI